MYKNYTLFFINETFKFPNVDNSLLMKKILPDNE